MNSTHSRLLVALVVLVATVGATPAAAQTDDEGVLDGVLTADEEASKLDAVRAVAQGLQQRVLGTLGAVGDDTTASDAADDAQAAFNERRAAFTEYANARTDASTDADVLELEFALNDETDTRYVVADVNGSDYENVSMTESTDQTVDETCRLEDGAARNAAAEIEQFDETFVSEDRDVTRSYLLSLGTEYAGNVDCSFNESEVSR